MREFIANTPWSVILPAVTLMAFVIGIVWKSAQDKTVQVVRNLTIKPGDLNARDLQEYARTQEL